MHDQTELRPKLLEYRIACTFGLGHVDAAIFTMFMFFVDTFVYCNQYIYYMSFKSPFILDTHSFNMQGKTGVEVEVGNINVFILEKILKYPLIILF